MEISIVEFLCCGQSFNSEDLNCMRQLLLPEGAAMAAALARDLSNNHLFEPSILWNTNHGSPPDSIVNWAFPIDSLSDWIDEKLSKPDSAVFLITPEIENQLAIMAKKIELSGRRLLGADSQSLHFATNKFLVTNQMRDFGIPIPISLLASSDQWKTQSHVNQWILKPIRGTGCFGIEKHDFPSLAERLSQLDNPDQYLLQEFIDGQCGSMCAIVHSDRDPMWMPPCAQSIDHTNFDNVFSLAYTGGITNTIDFDTQNLRTQLSEFLRKYHPRLSGWIGFDFIVSCDGDLFVLEMNSRLTTSFVGLSRLASSPLGEYLCKLLINDPSNPRPTIDNHTRISFGTDGTITT